VIISTPVCLTVHFHSITYLAMSLSLPLALPLPLPLLLLLSIHPCAGQCRSPGTAQPHSFNSHGDRRLCRYCRYGIADSHKIAAQAQTTLASCCCDCGSCSDIPIFQIFQIFQSRHRTSQQPPLQVSVGSSSAAAWPLHAR